MSSYRVYVGTFGKYAAGSLKGKWLDPEDYNDNNGMKACQNCMPARDESSRWDHEGVPLPVHRRVCGSTRSSGITSTRHRRGQREAYMALLDEWDEDQCNERRYEGQVSVGRDYVQRTDAKAVGYWKVSRKPPLLR